MQALPGCLQLDTALALKKDSLCNSYTVTRPCSERLGLIRVYQQKHNHRSVYRPQILFRLLTDAEAIKYKLENSTSKLCPLPISYNQYYLSKGFISDPFYLFLKHQIHSDFFLFSDEPTGTGSRNEIQYATFSEDMGKLLSLRFIIRKMVLNKTVHRIKRVNEDQALDE